MCGIPSTGNTPQGGPTLKYTKTKGEVVFGSRGDLEEGLSERLSVHRPNIMLTPKVFNPNILQPQDSLTPKYCSPTIS